MLAPRSKDRWKYGVRNVLSTTTIIYSVGVCVSVCVCVCVCAYVQSNLR